ncbi:hypothetical protein D3C77_210090 [compost metagenome]
MVEMPPALPPITTCEIQAAREVSPPPQTLIARRQAAVQRAPGESATAPYGHSAKGTLVNGECWGAHATTYILRFSEEEHLGRPTSGGGDPFVSIPAIRVPNLDRSNAKPLSF